MTEAVGFCLLMLRVHLAHMLGLVYPRMARMCLFTVSPCMVLNFQQMHVTPANAVMRHVWSGRTAKSLWLASVRCCHAGHDHAYARTCPFAMGKCTANTKTHQQPTKYSTSSSVSQGAVSEHVVDVVHIPQAPIYILAGHAGAGFTHSFPNPLPDWVVFGAENRNGYLRVTVSGGRLRVVSVSTDDGQIMDGVEIVRDQQHS